MIILFSLLLSITLSQIESRINPHGPTIAREFATCMSELIQQNCVDPGLLIFAHIKNESTSVWRINAELLQSIHEYNKYLVEIVTSADGHAICNKEDEAMIVISRRDLYSPTPNGNYYVITVDDYSSFSQVASKIARSSNWNPVASFIILLFDVTSSNDDKLKISENILQCLYMANVIRAVVLFPDKINLEKALVYGWKALDPPKYCGYSNETTRGRVTLQNTCEHGKLKNNIYSFGDVIPLDMMGCQLRVLALQRQPFISGDLRNPNIERQLVTELLQWFNYTPNFIMENSTRGEISDEGEWEGALKKIVERKGDILVGAIFPDDEVHRDFECSQTYLADSYTWVVARAERVPAWMAPIITFDKLVWYSTIAGCLISVFAWMCFGHISGDSAYHRSFGHCFLNTLISNLGFCAYARPAKKGLRVFFGFFNLYCIVFVTAFQTKLIDVLTSPRFDYQITSVEEILNSGKMIGGFEELHDLFYNSSDPLDNYIGNIWKNINSIDEAITDVVVHKNFSLLCSRLEMEFLYSTIAGLTDSFGNSKYYTLDENVFTVSVEMVALRGFPFIEEFSLMIGKFKQIGVPAKLRDRFHDMARQHRGILLDNLDDDDTPDVNSLSTLHLQGGFLVLVLGYICGFIVLLLEIFINSNYTKSKINKIKKNIKPRVNHQKPKSR